MIAWSVTSAAVCDSCGDEAASQELGQVLRGGRVCWDAEFRCPACEAAACLGFGTGETPLWVREPLLARHGTVRLRLTGPPPERVAVLRAVREASAGTLPQALEAARQLAGEGLPGTLPEAAWLRERLAARGVAAEVLSSRGPTGGRRG